MTTRNVVFWSHEARTNTDWGVLVYLCTCTCGVNLLDEPCSVEGFVSNDDVPKDECRVQLEGPEKEWWTVTKLGLLRVYQFPGHVTASDDSLWIWFALMHLFRSMSS